MNYASKTKDNLIKIIEMKDKELDENLDTCLYYNNRNDELREQQLILFWLLFIVAGLGFSF